MNILMLSDVRELSSIFQLQKSLVTRKKYIDAIVVAGGFVKPEEVDEMSACLGDMTAALDRLENIVCNVVYFPTEKDPEQSKGVGESKLHLTPQSLSCFHTPVALAPGLLVVGCERPQLLHERLLQCGSEPDEKTTYYTLRYPSEAAIQKHTSVIVVMEYCSEFQSELDQVLTKARAEFPHLNVLMCALGDGSTESDVAEGSIFTTGSLAQNHYLMVELEQQESLWSIKSHECQ